MHPRHRRLAFLSAATAVIAAVLALVLPLSSASASAVSAAGTRVGASHPQTILSVGVSQHVSAGGGRCEPVPQARTTAGLCVAAEEAGSGADNVVNGVRLAQQLTREEASSVFTPGGELQQEVIDQSHEIINGTRLGNKALVNELTSDGSSIADWGKYTTPTFRSPAGMFQVHFYYNSVTDDVFYGADYKAVFVGGSP